MKLLRQEKGITLVELLVAVVLLAVVVAGALRLFKSSNDNAIELTHSIKMQDQLKNLSSTIKKGLQSAGYQLNSAREGFVPHKDSVTVSFVDAFGYYQCTNNTVRVSYYLQDSVLVQRTNCGGTLTELSLAQNIDSLGFTYLNTLGTPTTTVDSIAEIEYTICLKSRSVKQDQTKSRTATARITFQNF